MESTTAEFMALFRALETASPAPDRLFADPYATRFLRPLLRGVAALGRSPIVRPALMALLDAAWPGARASGVSRTRFIDDVVMSAIEDGAQQVVLLGAGYDCRAHRLAAAGALPFFEVDEVGTQLRKAALVDAADAPRRAWVRYVPCDFERDRVAERLVASGFDTQLPAVVVLEGVTNYLSRSAVDDLFAQLRDVLSPGSRLVFTYVEPCALDQASVRSAGGDLSAGWLLRKTLRSVGERWTFGLDPRDLPHFLEERGFRLLEECGSVEYRRRYAPASRIRGYEFYRAAVASRDRADEEGA